MPLRHSLDADMLKDLLEWYRHRQRALTQESSQEHLQRFTVQCHVVRLQQRIDEIVQRLQSLGYRNVK